MAPLATCAGNSGACAKQWTPSRRRRAFDLPLRAAICGMAQPEQALGLIQSAEEQVRDQPQMLLAQAQAQQALGDLDAAVETLDALQRQSPDSGTPYLLLADLHAKRGDANAMEQALIAGATINPASGLLPSVLNNGLALYKEPAPKLALLDRLIEATKADPRLTAVKAELLVEQRQYGRAAQLMREMSSLYPSNAGVMRKLVGVLRAGQEDERARQVLQAWTAQHPADLVAALMLAQLQAELGNVDEARELLEGLAASEPALRSNPLIQNNLAWLLRDSDPAQARAYAERALLGDPSSAAIMDTLGSLLVESGELDRALTLLEAAHRAEPRDATIGFHYAIALAHAGRKVEARVLLLDLVDKRFPEQQAARALLAELDGP
jgi:predicted Zn-dependent protease